MRSLGHLYEGTQTETYLSTFTNSPDVEFRDKTLHKAIKQNDPSIILPHQREGHTETALLYDEEKEMMATIVEMRKKYDAAKNETAATDKNIHRMEEQREKLENIIKEMQKDMETTREGYAQLSQNEKQAEELVQVGDYTLAVRLNMKDTLRHDILTIKKNCFDQNVRLIRTKTYLKEILQRASNKKHHKSRCKLVLNSLQATVQAREADRQHHLISVEEMVRKKMENLELKQTREQFLEDSLYRALTDKLPEQKFLVGKLSCELFVQALLRNKMKKIVEKFKEVEQSFNVIRKATRIQTTSQFIDEFMRKQAKYGQLLESIQRAEAKINRQKEIRRELQAEHETLEFKMYELQKMMESSHHPKEHSRLNNKLVRYNQQLLRCQQLGIGMKRWSVNTILKMQYKSLKGEKLSECAKQLQAVSLKNIITRNLQNILKAVQEVEKEEERQVETKALTPQRKSEMTTERTEGKIKLRDITDGSVLSKEQSRRNFRVKTVAGSHQETLEEKDYEYDEGAEFDFLRHNRKVVKKNNKVIVGRPRFKTKAF